MIFELLSLYLYSALNEINIWFDQPITITCSIFRMQLRIAKTNYLNRLKSNTNLETYFATENIAGCR